MKLNLKRPLVFFDLETTGVTIGTDRIVEISMVKVLIDNSLEVKTLKINPEIPIPLESSLVHGIYDEDVAGEAIFAKVAKEVAAFIGDADLAGYNSNKFDIPLLLEEFLRVNCDFEMQDRKFVDVQNIFHQMEPRTLKAAYKFYCEKDLLNAHSAEADTMATYEVFKSQLERYEGKAFENKKGEISYPVQNDVDALYAFTNLHKTVDYAGRLVKNDADEVCFNFGKHKGKTVIEVFEKEPSYYDWMKKGDFPLFTKKKLEELWNAWREKKQKPREEIIKPKPVEKKIAPKKESVNISNQMLLDLKDKFGK